MDFIVEKFLNSDDEVVWVARHPNLKFLVIIHKDKNEALRLIKEAITKRGLDKLINA